MTRPTPSSSADDLHENALVWQDLIRAREWSLDAVFIEKKTGGSTLAVACARLVEQGELTEEIWQALNWSLDTGGSIGALEQESASLFFAITRSAGAPRAWRLLIDAGYSVEPVSARFKESGFRSTTKLGLLCCAPYCLAPDLACLIRLLTEKGVDPNERDSEGVSPLGRLNEQIKLQESAASGGEAVGRLLRGAEALLESGATPESILPEPEAFAAKSLKTRIKAAQERRSLAAEIEVPNEPGEPARLPGWRGL